MGSRSETHEAGSSWADRYPELGTAPIPSGAYTSASYLESEIAFVFRASWLNVARVDDLPQEGSYLALDLAQVGASLLLVRGRDLVIRAFYNACTHRGSRLASLGAGHRSLWTCRYHGWTFGLDGRLMAVPDERKFAGLERANCGLKSVACGEWNGFVFVNLAPEPVRPLNDFLADLAPAFDGFPFEQLRRRVTYVAEVEANWKVALDIGEEPYHFRFVHRKSLPDSHTGVGQDLAYFPSIRLYAQHRSASVVANPAHALRPSERIAFAEALTMIQGGAPRSTVSGLNLDAVPNWAFDVHVLFPNCAVLLGPGWMVVHRFWPLAVARTRWETTLHMTPARNAGELISQEFSKILTRDLLREDLAMVEVNQQGLQTGATGVLRLSDEEILLRHSHRAVDAAVRAGAQRCSSDRVHIVHGGGRRRLISGAQVIDGTGRAPLPEHSVLVEGGVIGAVLPRRHDAAIDAERIDASGRTLMPGLVDMHAHLISGGFDTIVDSGASYETDTQRRALAQMLYWGITGCHYSVQPLANAAWLRESLASGDLIGPRLAVSGPGITAPAGWAGSNVPDARLELDTVAAVPAAISTLAEAGVDFVKVFYDDMCCAFRQPMPKLRADVLQAVVREAHRHGLPVAVHVYDIGGHREAMRAGADLLYHSAVTGQIDDAYVALAKSAGSAYVATLSIYHDTYDPSAVRRWAQTPDVVRTVPAATLETLEPGGPLDLFETHTRRADIARQLPVIAYNLHWVFQAGVPFAVGPDTGVPGVFPGISVHREMELMVQAGVPALDVIGAATRQAAALMGDPSGGTIARGKRADLVLLSADPIEDIRSTRAIEAVMQGGELVDRAGLLRSIMSPAGS
jgi:phenylpropionate dioxygenase-like ring-hydroxylating dioxygenase large terminal subunit/imidazolonepropionase-like amidohydrolase